MQITLLESHSNPKPIGYSTFKQLLNDVLLKPEMVEAGKNLAELAMSDNEAFKKKKERLPAFIIGKFSYRNAESCEVMEPYFCFDIDKIEPADVTQMLDKLQEWEYTCAAYPSVSGMGIRLIVKAEFEAGARLPMYNLAASVLSAYLGIPAEEEKKREDIPGAYINTSTHDLPRLWYYSGITDYRSRSSFKSFKSPAQLPTPPQNRVQSGASESEKVEATVREIERRGIDLTSDYDSWMRVGMSLASFGEAGRDWFHRVSAMYSGYTHKECERKFDDYVKKASGKVTIATFFKFAKDAGVNVFPSHRQYDHLSPEGTRYEDTDLEALICSHIIRHRDRYDELISSFPLISAKCFRDEINRAIFEAVEKLSLLGRYIDPQTVQSVVGPDAVASVSKKPIPSNEAAVGYCQIVYSLYRKSEIQAALAKAAGDVMLDEADPDVRLSELDREVSAISSGIEADDDGIASAVDASQKRRIDLFIRANSNKDAIAGITTGIKAEDTLTGGRMEGSLGILAARPAMGKTSRMLTEARIAAKSGIKVGIFSLEMKREELAKRMTCQEGEISNAKMKAPHVNINFAEKEHEYIENIEAQVRALPILIDDKCNTMSSITSKARAWVRAKGVKAIYLENLGLIKPEGKRTSNKADEVGDMTRDFKALAKELNIPITLVVQLNRSTETKGGSKRPSLHELRDSGRIEEDADWVAFVYRPEYYGITEDEAGNSTKGVAEIIYAKHRDGELDTIRCEFVGDMFLFRDLQPKPFSPHKHVAEPIIPAKTGDSFGEGDKFDIF